MVKCSQCRTQNRDDTKYCKNCGMRLNTNSLIPCNKCGTQNPASSLFCNRCGEKLGKAVPASASLKSATPIKTGRPAPSVAHAKPVAVATRVASEQLASRTTKPKEKETPLENMPEWIARFYVAPANQTRLVPTHDLLKMAQALGVGVDYNTLRFWQKRGLVPKPIRGRVSSGRGTRGYYDPSLIDRLGFIREIQKMYAMGLDAIREELRQIDHQIVQAGNGSTDPYKERLAQLQSQRQIEAKKTLISVLCKALKLDPEQIDSVTIEMKDSAPISFLSQNSRTTKQIISNLKTVTETSNRF